MSSLKKFFGLLNQSYLYKQTKLTCIYTSEIAMFVKALKDYSLVTWVSVDHVQDRFYLTIYLKYTTTTKPLFRIKSINQYKVVTQRAYLSILKNLRSTIFPIACVKHGVEYKLITADTLKNKTYHLPSGHVICYLLPNK